MIRVWRRENLHTPLIGHGDVLHDAVDTPVQSAPPYSGDGFVHVLFQEIATRESISMIHIVNDTRSTYRIKEPPPQVRLQSDHVDHPYYT
jgi:hypothetical protein